ncbi:hypothetical protein K469DRAFT_724955 [Zopfia rhizophila CBS 207.26]|uniref:Uncharacterized protein n=1 Tax=Zopfia rhizophila CBS 207.26 TaxID=1314779 RepID=A0A6A6DB52_9PEZI|nr:hypothetical protein K469DRAFT_724955 [Zopfia rhizophila CBS 207.26]
MERQRRSGVGVEGLLALSREMEGDDDAQHDVDLNILDFLEYKATQTVFQWRTGSNPHQSDLPGALVTMTDDWMTFIKHKHGRGSLNNQATFRSRLLQFVLMFTHRLNHDNTWTNDRALSEIRAQNKYRGSYWQETPHSPALRNPFDTYKEFPLSDGTLAENRHELASSLGMPESKRRWVTDLYGTPSLHSLLPLFIELTAARTAIGDGWETKPQWFQLAGQFMLQAVIEEYLRNGAFGEEPFNTIFAFGCPGRGVGSDEGADIRAMRILFCKENDSHEQVHGWARVKRQYINELLPQPGSSTTFLQAMESTKHRFPYTEFENTMLEFLMDLHNSLDKPDLVQVEQGEITINGNRLPETESREMFRRMGL